MKSNAGQSKDKLLQLLADRATEGLSPAGTRELDELLAAHPDNDLHSFEQAAAAIDLATMPPVSESLPSQLRDRILTDAGKILATMDRWQAAPPVNSEPLDTKLKAVPNAWSGRLGWYLAAASLGLATLVWWQDQSGERRPIPTRPVSYAQFVDGTADLVRSPWSGQETGYKGLSGDVVWSDSKQRGFMRFVGLQPNVLGVSQYQLWIVDPRRDKHPIDGGVFDVLTTGEVVIPIEAKLKVENPTVFAITLEKPGGVVVSGGPLLAVAKVAG